MEDATITSKAPCPATSSITKGLEPPVMNAKRPRPAPRPTRPPSRSRGSSSSEETGGQEIEDDQDELERERKQGSRDRRAVRVRRQYRGEQTTVGCARGSQGEAPCEAEPTEPLQEVAPYRRVRKLQSRIDAEVVHSAGSRADTRLHRRRPRRSTECDEQPNHESEHEQLVYVAKHALLPEGLWGVVRWSHYLRNATRRRGAIS